ncbi:hypothetical protein NDU88_005284 [Pleurodeles waltl]|uniref:Myb/SANT-like DNA-binding domain-containing protein n=1 Tax=Pleurodeles waltl TaxID=8319 RepID=A0AAV7PF28_PLEWA|nr:hypothetical protein NDU88_005284 [Pleurodeles waltl]
MAAVSGERAPAFTAQELEKLVDGVLPQYTLLYGPPDQQVSAHQKKDIWGAIAKDVRTLGVHQRRGTHCRKRWEDIRRWSKKTAEAQLGMASQRGRGARRTMTPLMFRILAVAYPELDGCFRASQQTQGEYQSVAGNEVKMAYVALLDSKEREHMTIKAVNSATRDEVKDSRGIAETSADHLEKFYASQLRVTLLEIMDFITNCPVERLGKHEARELDLEISVKEVASAPGKAQGQNGLPLEILKTLCHRGPATLHVAYDRTFQDE